MTQLDYICLLLFLLNGAGWLIYYISAFWTKDRRFFWGFRLLLAGLVAQVVICLTVVLAQESNNSTDAASLFLVFAFLNGALFIIVSNRSTSVQERRLPSAMNGVLIFVMGGFGFYGYNEFSFLGNLPFSDRFLGFFHNATLNISYLLLGMASIVAIVFLYQERQIKRKTISLKINRIPSLGVMDSVIRRSLMAGLLFIAIRIPTGFAVSLRENAGEAMIISPRLVLLALIWSTCLFFLVQLSTRKAKGRSTAITAITGFSLMVTLHMLDIGVWARFF